MAIPFKNVTVLIQPVSQTKLEDDTLANPATVAGFSCNAHLQNISYKEAVEKFAENFETWGVALLSPAALFLDVSDWIAGAQQMGVTPGQMNTLLADGQVTVTTHIAGKGLFDGNTYAIKGRPLSFDQGLAVDHVMLLLGQKAYPI